MVAQLLGQLAQLLGEVDARIRGGVALLELRGGLIQALGLLLGLVAHLLALRDDVVLRVGEQQRGDQQECAEGRCRALPAGQRDTKSARVGAEQGAQRVTALEPDEVLVDGRVRVVTVCFRANTRFGGGQLRLGRRERQRCGDSIVQAVLGVDGEGRFGQRRPNADNVDSQHDETDDHDGHGGGKVKIEGINRAMTAKRQLDCRDRGKDQAAVADDAPQPDSATETAKGAAQL